MLKRLFALAVILLSPTSTVWAADIALRLPLDCEIGKTCWVQNYLDHDPSRGIRDYACLGQTYDAHTGTDFRLPTQAAMKKGVAVLSAADGRVTRLRDGIADISVRERGIEAVRGEECGNGVVVAHADGWETQYCHMRQGSVAVRPGTEVKAGDPLGRVGLSGNTEFAHVHLTVRKDGKVVDPFAYGGAEGACNSGTSLWEPGIRAALAYRPVAILNRGFADKAVKMEDVEDGNVEAPSLGSDPAALIAYVRAIGLRRSDVLRLTIQEPDGRSFVEHTEPPLNADKAQQLIFVGRRRQPDGWKGGAYRATYSVTRDGMTAIEEHFEIIR